MTFAQIWPLFRNATTSNWEIAKPSRRVTKQFIHANETYPPRYRAAVTSFRNSGLTWGCINSACFRHICRGDILKSAQKTMLIGVLLGLMFNIIMKSQCVNKNLQHYWHGYVNISILRGRQSECNLFQFSFLYLHWFQPIVPDYLKLHLNAPVFKCTCDTLWI